MTLQGMYTKLSSNVLTKVQVDLIENYILNLYVHNAYILHILRLLFRLAEDDDECMVARKYSDCVIEQIDFLRSKILQELNEN